MGGSVCNEFIRRLDRPGLHIVAGLNLAMLLEMIANVDLPIDDVIRSAVELSRESIVYCNPLAVGTPWNAAVFKGGMNDDQTVEGG